MTARIKALGDQALEKVISKKLLVWVLSTIMLFMSIINNDQWFMITMLWLGGVSIIDITTKFMEAKSAK